MVLHEIILESRHDKLKILKSMIIQLLLVRGYISFVTTNHVYFLLEEVKKE